jgi:hypothetical protein
MRRSLTKTLIFYFIFLIPYCVFSQILSINDQVENIYAFTKLYGYVKYFHPSDEASRIDWAKFAILGVKKVQFAKSKEELKNTLNYLFLPIAPLAHIFTTKVDTKNSIDFFQADTSKANIIAWQHLGVDCRSGKSSNIYKSSRVLKLMDKVNPKEPIHQLLNFTDTDIQIEKLFKKYPKANEVFKASLGSRLYCEIPLTLKYDSLSTIVKSNRSQFIKILDKINIIDTAIMNADNRYVRLANIVIAWNVFQHFFPYFDVLNIDWGTALNESLYEAIQENTSNEFYDTLRQMIAKLNDGHGYVYYKNKEWGGIPIKVEWIENECVVTASEDTLFQIGDIIKEIDGDKSAEYLHSKESMISGSQQLKRFRALNQFGMGHIGSIAVLTILRDNKLIQLKVKRKEETRGFAFNQITPFKFPKIKKIENGIYYINLATIDRNEFNQNMDELSTARGIVFDYRWDGKNKYIYDLENLRTIVEHITDRNIKSIIMRVPNVIYPDCREITFEEKQGTYEPILPRFRSKNIFIIEPFVGSSLETDICTIDFYKFGETIGQSTGGFNGNVNFIPLIGGFSIRWTGMKVLKQDGSQYNLIGIKPTYPVEKTIKALNEGRDEYLEKALEILKGKIKN